MSGTAIEPNAGQNQQQPDAHVGDAARAADTTATETVAQDDEEQKQIDEAAEEEAREKLRREREARAQALTLEIVGDLPFAEVKPPENVLFVCKLNPVTEDEDLETIFSRFGTIVSCEVIRDKRTKDSLQYAFIEFEHQKDCEQAYFKMQGVLIDDHRIHVDFSQSVSRLSDKWRTATNSKRAKQGGGFGGEANLEKRRQYRVDDRKKEDAGRRSDMVFEKDDYNRTRSDRDGHRTHDRNRAHRSRSPRRRSPTSHERYSKYGSPRDRDDGRESHRRDRYDERDRRRYR